VAIFLAEAPARTHVHLLMCRVRRASQLPGLMPTGDNRKPTLPLELLTEEKETVSEPVTPIRCALQ
jgi:hypothetical protein